LLASFREQIACRSYRKVSNLYRCARDRVQKPPEQRKTVPYITPAPSQAPPSNSGSISMPAPIKAALVTNLPAPVSSTPLLADGASEVPVPIGDVSSAGL
jgi:hypothetical protein